MAWARTLISQLKWNKPVSIDDVFITCQVHDFVRYLVELSDLTKEVAINVVPDKTLRSWYCLG